MKKYVNFTKILLASFIGWFLIHSLVISVDGLTDHKRNADVAIVLGNKINEDGTPSPRLKARLDKCVELYTNHRVSKVIVSGGFGKEGFWEANKMKDYLISKNVPAQKIITDNYGNDTEKTVKNSMEIMDSLKMKSAISVSQFFHQTRIKKLFKNNGFKNIESASPSYFELRDFYSLLREFVAYYKEAL